MIRKSLLLITIILGGLAHANAQGPPNLNAIQTISSDAFSPYYIENLLTRYKADDTTLNAKEYEYLYYGFPETKDYKPLLPSPYTDSLESILSRRSDPSKQNMKTAEYYARQVLELHPFSIRNINVLAFTLSSQGKKLEAEKLMFKINMLINTIKNSGDGKTEKTPLYVIMNDTPEDYTAFIGLIATRSMIASSSVVFLQISNMPIKKDKGLYFNISEIYKRKPTYMKNYKPKRKMELNPRYNPKSDLNVLPSKN